MVNHSTGDKAGSKSAETPCTPPNSLVKDSAIEGPHLEMRSLMEILGFVSALSSFNNNDGGEVLRTINGIKK